MDTLPPELLVAIFDTMPHDSRLLFSSVCSHFRELLQGILFQSLKIVIHHDKDAKETRHLFNFLGRQEINSSVRYLTVRVSADFEIQEPSAAQSQVLHFAAVSKLQNLISLLIEGITFVADELSSISKLPCLNELHIIRCKNRLSPNVTIQSLPHLSFLNLVGLENGEWAHRLAHPDRLECLIVDESNTARLTMEVLPPFTNLRTVAVDCAAFNVPHFADWLKSCHLLEEFHCYRTFDQQGELQATLVIRCADLFPLLKILHGPQEFVCNFVRAHSNPIPHLTIVDSQGTVEMQNELLEFLIFLRRDTTLSLHLALTSISASLLSVLCRFQNLTILGLEIDTIDASIAESLEAIQELFDNLGSKLPLTLKHFAFFATNFPVPLELDNEALSRRLSFLSHCQRLRYVSFCDEKNAVYYDPASMARLEKIKYIATKQREDEGLYVPRYLPW